MDKYAQNLTVLLTERRGDIVAMALIRRTVDHRLIDVSCVARLAPGSRDVHDADAAGGTGLGYPGPQARSFTQRDVGFHFGGADDGGSLISGEVGSDVVGVTANVDGRPIAATIRDGAYAAWWPSTVRWDTDQAPPGQKFDADPEITFDLTFKDGTVERNARGYTPEVPADGLGGSQTMGQETSP